MSRRHFSLTIPAAIIAFAAPAAAQGTFTRLGEPDTYLGDISADGAIAVGARSNFSPAFRWTATGGVVNIGGAGATAKITRDGRTTVSNAKDSQGLTNAAIWQGGTNWRVLGGVPDGKPMDTF